MEYDIYKAAGEMEIWYIFFLLEMQNKAKEEKEKKDQFVRTKNLCWHHFFYVHDNSAITVQAKNKEITCTSVDDTEITSSQ